MTNQVKRPARLDIVDMPRDTTRALGGLRQAICASFNYCRKYPAKMAILKEVLKYTYNRIVAWEKEHAAQLEQAAKVKLEAEGKELGIDLDSRKTVENMTKDLEAHKAKLAEEAAKQAEEDEKAKADQSDDDGKKDAETSGESPESTTNESVKQADKGE